MEMRCTVGDLAQARNRLSANDPELAAHVRKLAGAKSKPSWTSEAVEGLRDISQPPAAEVAPPDFELESIVQRRPHLLSAVLTGAMFDIIIRLSRYYIDVRERKLLPAFWDTIQRMQQMAIQPLDLLPPVEVTFKDYALAVLRMEQIANPSDPDDYRGMMMEVFQQRGILDEEDVKDLKEPRQVFERLTRRPSRRRADLHVADGGLQIPGRQSRSPPHTEQRRRHRVGPLQGAEADSAGAVGSLNR
jgi:hypothetical protein